MKRRTLTVIQVLIALMALVGSVAVFHRQVVRTINRALAQNPNTDAYRDAAIFSALKYDDAFGYKVCLPNDGWVKLVIIPTARVRPKDDDWIAHGIFYATASDGRRVKKRCVALGTELDTAVLKINSGATIDDVLYHPFLRSDFCIEMMDNYDDFRSQPDFKELEMPGRWWE